ncbi:leucine-rich repeat domain-containing protein [uncultured Microscilla sp.]|uniref:leucine-rich repeat domain-containing protein n=1 Tax=uncultured Microscilla sp. TaxID=432653 RepID=UPI0026223A69|nr:leucine-rich repeat domain-containing protein [uncultured Microscilla sp.]
MNKSININWRVLLVVGWVIMMAGCAPKTYTSLEEAMKHPEKVESLTLAWERLRTFPKEILQMKNLQRLNLKNNQLHSLPAEIATLQKLERIDLSNNKFKTLPIGVDKLPKLERLQLMRNPIPKELRAAILKKLPNTAMNF